jgi:undecaprenyl-diphosphatase
MISRRPPTHAAATTAVPEPATRTAGFADTVRAIAAAALRPTRRNVLHWLSWAVALAVELAITFAVRDGEIVAWERSLARRLQDSAGRELVFDLVSSWTNVWTVPFFVVFLAIVAATSVWYRRDAAALMLLTIPMHVLVQFPKALVDRPRPPAGFPGLFGVGGGQSFPSGHAAYAMSFYGFLTYLLVRHLETRWARAFAVGGWLAFVLATGFARVANGRHWPLDVLGAYAAGLGALSGLIWLDAAVRAGRRDARTVSATLTSI